MHILKSITSAVKVPVTADIESGYATNNNTLKENIKQLLNIGIVGINIEDSCHGNGKMYSITDQCMRIKSIRQAANEMGIPLFINARTDVMLKEKKLNDEEMLNLVKLRGIAYCDAGADCFFPVLVKEKEDIECIIQTVNLPVNLLLVPGIPDFAVLSSIGLARLSIGPGFLKIAINAMKNTAEALKIQNGMKSLIENPVSTTFLNDLVTKN